MSSERSDHSGGCLCGAVRYRSPGPDSGNAACHCSQCRRWSGHFWASVMLPADTFEVTGQPKWHQSSDHAERGFCANCGTALFWREPGSDIISVGMGTLDAPTGLHLQQHIYVGSKGDYYDLADGLPQDKGQ